MNNPNRYMTLILGMVLLLGILPANAAATTRPKQPEARLHATVVEKIAAELLDSYIDTPVAAQCASRIRTRLNSGAYQGAKSPKAFASRITADLRKITHDKHLSVRASDPEKAQVERENPTLAAFQRDWHGSARNHGFHGVEILEGNVGYLDVRYFSFHQDALATASAALKFLNNADALIVDLRQSNGGNPAMVQYLLSHFLEPNTALTGIFWRARGEIEEARALDSIPGPRRVDIPIFVLTSKMTISAAEAFTHDLQILDRATIVGETTAGAGNPSRRVILNQKLVLFVPIGKAVHPKTGTSWEGIGVEPDIKIVARSALHKTQKLAKVAAARHRNANMAAKTESVLNIVKQLEAAEILIAEGNIAAAKAQVAPAMMKAIELGHIIEGQINRIGYRYFGQDAQLDLSLVLFGINVDAVPASSNAHDSLAEAYARKGDNARAIEHYQRAVELDSSNAGSKNRLRELRGTTSSSGKP